MNVKSTLLTVGLVGILCAGCSSDDGDNVPDRNELAEALSGGKADDDLIDGLCKRAGADAGCDLCDALSLYDDGTCDDYCPTRDGDCGAPEFSVGRCTEQDLQDAGFVGGYTLNSVKIEGTELVASLSFGGGCAEHDFALCIDGDSLLLGHDANGDFCEAFLTQEVRFDLSDELGTTPTTLNLVGWDGTLSYGGETGPAQVELCSSARIDALKTAGYFVDNSAASAVSIDNGELVINARFGGGCETHDFAVCWDGRILESFPPQASLTLYHNANGDFCEAFLSEELRFGLDLFNREDIYLNIGEHSVFHQP